jgi:hypothetical protein
MASNVLLTAAAGQDPRAPRQLLLAETAASLHMCWSRIPSSEDGMDVDKLSHYSSRTFFFLALLLFVVAVIEWVLAVLGVMRPRLYLPGRLIEFAAMFLLPVITVLLRQIREELRKGKQA